MTDQPLLQVKNLQQYFPVKAGLFSKIVGHIQAVDNISFDVYPGETVSLVGESGCGKSTTGKAILRLEEPTAGEIFFQGEDILALGKKELRKRRKDIQIIFQDPFASLNPRHTVRQILGEALSVQRIISKQEQLKRIQELLEAVGLSAEHINRYPHEFSGGQRQRIAIARALAVEPKLIICDEAVSALDVSVQAQVLNLLKKLQREFNLTYLFISHDLSVVRYLSDRIMVMYLGKIVEIADRQSLFEHPRHPYTQALLSAIPIADTRIKKKRIFLTGDIPSPLNPPLGCRFQTRCPFVIERCRKEEPELMQVGPKHEVACHVVKLLKS